MRSSQTPKVGSETTIRPLGPVMGAEVAGFELSRPIPEPTFQQLVDAFNEYKLLCFRSQQLTMDQLISFSKRWGPLVEHTMPGQLREGAPDVINVATNADDHGRPSGKHPDPTAMRWHTDRSWRAKPAMATLLYGVETPISGGDTLFTNCTMAYDALPDDIKRRIDPLKAIHSVEYSRRAAGGPPATEYELRIGPPTAHPLARRHPATGKRAIYVGSHVWKIEGLNEDEGGELLKFLQEFAVQDRFMYRHQWQKGDLVMWDNRCVLHRATPYEADKYVRTMWRTVIDGEPTT